jgi:hypothetical protein
MNGIGALLKNSFEKKKFFCEALKKALNQQRVTTG